MFLEHVVQVFLDFDYPDLLHLLLDQLLFKFDLVCDIPNHKDDFICSVNLNTVLAENDGAVFALSLCKLDVEHW